MINCRSQINCSSLLRYQFFIGVIFLTFALNVLPAQKIIYIDATNGNDSNNGLSPDSAWQTISKVLSMSSSFDPGDSILFKRGEIWNGNRIISFTHPSGSLNHYITYGAYGTGAKPIINIHTSQTPSWVNKGDSVWTTITTAGARFFKNGTEMLRLPPALDSTLLGQYGTEYYTKITPENKLKIYLYCETNPADSTFSWSPYSYVMGLNNSDYIKIVDLDFQGGASSSIYLNNNKGWKIINCNIGKNAAVGVKIKNSSDILIRSCNMDANFTVDQSTLPPGGSGIDYSGCDDGIFVTTGSSNIEIDRCYFKNWGHASFSSNTTDSLNKVSGIKFYNNELTTPDIIYGGRIAYSGYSEDGEYYNNYIHDISVQNQLGGSRNHFHNNIIDGVLDSPLKTDAIGAGIKLSNYNIQVKNNIIENNVISNTENEGIIIYSINFDYPGEFSGNIIRNNIVYNCGKILNNVGIQFHKDSLGQGIYNNLMQNNLVYSDSTNQTCRYQYNGTVSDVATFNNQDADISNNIDNNPMFIDALNANYHLLGNSPCIDAGTTAITGSDYEYNPIPLMEKPDIGAFEYGIYWTGNVSNEWHNTGNWSINSIPTVTDIVTIPPPQFYRYFPKVNANAQVKKIYINENAKIWINGAVVFSINGL